MQKYLYLRRDGRKVLLLACLHSAVGAVYPETTRFKLAFPFLALVERST